MSRGPRLFAAVGTLAAFLVIALTGLVLFIHPKGAWEILHKASKSLHQWFGFVLIGFAVLHLLFNVKALAGRLRPVGAWKAVAGAVGLCVVLAVLAVADKPLKHEAKKNRQRQRHGPVGRFVQPQGTQQDRVLPATMLVGLDR